MKEEGIIEVDLTIDPIFGWSPKARTFPVYISRISQIHETTKDNGEPFTVIICRVSPYRLFTRETKEQIEKKIKEVTI